jgi:hypothetical protein
VSLHQSKHAPYSGATKGTTPSCLLVFSKFFKKKSDNFVETNRTSERFFKRKLELAKGKDDGLRGMASRYSFKAPSANASAATT